MIIGTTTAIVETAGIKGLLVPPLTSAEIVIKVESEQDYIYVCSSILVLNILPTLPSIRMVYTST